MLALLRCSLPVDPESLKMFMKPVLTDAFEERWIVKTLLPASGTFGTDPMMSESFGDF